MACCGEKPRSSQKRTFPKERAVLSFCFENNRYSPGKGLTQMVRIDYWAGGQVETGPAAGQAYNRGARAGTGMLTFSPALAPHPGRV